MSTMFHPLSPPAPARRAFVRTSSWPGRVGFFELTTRRRPWPRLARGNPSIIGIRHLIKTTQIITVRWLYVLRSNAQNTEEKEETISVCVVSKFNIEQMWLLCWMRISVTKEEYFFKYHLIILSWHHHDGSHRNNKNIMSVVPDLKSPPL